MLMRTLIAGSLLVGSVVLTTSASYALDYVELPVLAAVRSNNLGVFEIMLMGWDKKADPNAVQLQVYIAGVRLRGRTHPRTAPYGNRLRPGRDLPANNE